MHMPFQQIQTSSINLINRVRAVSYRAECCNIDVLSELALRADNNEHIDRRTD